MIFFLRYVKIGLAVLYADVAELADVQDLGSCVHDVQVRPLSSAPLRVFLYDLSISMRTLVFYVGIHIFSITVSSILN